MRRAVADNILKILSDWDTFKCTPDTSVMTFDLAPPTGYGYKDHVRKLSERLLRLADMAYEDMNLGMRAMLTCPYVAVLMESQERFQAVKDVRMEGTRWMHGTWRGHPVWVDTRVPDWLGCITSDNGDVIGVFQVLNA